MLPRARSRGSGSTRAWSGYRKVSSKWSGGAVTSAGRLRLPHPPPAPPHPLGHQPLEAHRIVPRQPRVAPLRPDPSPELPGPSVGFRARPMLLEPHLRRVYRHPDVHAGLSLHVVGVLPPKAVVVHHRRIEVDDVDVAIRCRRPALLPLLPAMVASRSRVLGADGVSPPVLNWCARARIACARGRGSRRERLDRVSRCVMSSPRPAALIVTVALPTECRKTS